MKLKELPASLLTAYRLSRLPLDELRRPGNDVLENCLVSMTSIESRLPILHLCVRSLLRQTVAPVKVVLWLHHALQSKVPARLLRLIGDTFEIRYSEQTCAHRKLVETLKLFPQKIIVTCDDDLMYPADWLERLWREHLDYPHNVVAHECRRIAYDGQGQLLPYAQWPSELAGGSSVLTMSIGYGGVLYPPGCLDSAVTDRVLYDRLAPKADDLWFKAMSLRAGTAVRRSHMPNPKPTPIFFSQASALKKFNVREDGNRRQWQQLSDHFQLLGDVIE